MAVIYWDFDGTLVYSKSLWSPNVYRAIAEEYDKAVFADVKEYMQTCFTWNNPYENFAELKEEKWWEYMNNHFKKCYIKQGAPQKTAEKAALKVREYIKEIGNYTLYDDAIQTLTTCKKLGHTNVVLSNNYPDLIEVITNLGIAKYFDNFIVSAKYGYDKPRRELFEIAKALYPDESTFYMVGDNAYADIEGGNSAGMTTILVHRGFDANANYCFENLACILDIL